MALNDNSLGKSLSSVFAKTGKKESPGGRGFLEVDLNLLIPPADNPRQVFDDDQLDELASSIRLHGILQPIVVMKRDGGYEILAGERRYRAAKRIGLTAVPVVVHGPAEANEIAEIRLVENIQREDLNPIELAEAYRALMQQHGLTQEQVAAKVGKERSSVTNCLRLLTLPAAIQSLVGEGRLNMGHARALIPIEDPGACLRLARRAIEEGMSVRAVEQAVRDLATGSQAPASTQTAAGSSGPVKPAAIRELEGNLERLFDAKVDIKERGGKGALTIRFHSKGHFKTVIDQLEQAFEAARRTDGTP